MTENACDDPVTLSAATVEEFFPGRRARSEVRLDLGAGPISPAGYRPLGRRFGSEIYPLAAADASVDVIRASHVLEHFPDRQVAEVIKDWVRALRPGGVLRIAVPDFGEIAKRYLAGDHLPTGSYIMGAQVDADDYHKALFDRGRLRQIMADAGLILLRPWQSEIDDCARYPISLNIEGTRPFACEIKVAAAMSVPRLGFMDNFGCCIDALLPLGIRLRRQGGAFWGQALQNCMEVILEQDQPDAILTLDYDSVFTIADVALLMQLMLAHPEADAIVALQSSRHLPTALFTKKDAAGEPIGLLNTELMQPDLMRVSAAHFGLTLIRAARLAALPKPWFMPVAAPNGEWHVDSGKIDEDINFWVQWEKAGNTLFLANRVVIGHAEIMVRWPGPDLQAMFQPIREFNESGAPAGVWK